MDYEILVSESLEGLTGKVREHIQSGWQPQGGVAVFEVSENDFSRVGFRYMQAMVRREVTK